MNLTKLCYLLLFILLIGCTSQKEVIKQLKSKSSDTYTLHVFKEDSGADELDKEVNRIWNKNIKKIESVQFYDNFQKRNKEMIKALDIADFPTFVVVDDAKIVLKTTDLNDVNKIWSE
ncbi:hypothetical protein [Paenibacillus lutrae]|uniref:Small peptidoglycan-associated lipoprotein n=1 Tax=Paenibacillus lutrae TaxID=2078573 RepID=A0A7X3FIF5_9BACL|nr:hypothetical protein [Paenibacillus lutrae]MVO99941.1 hypothetical protein [Paenibacillus lutrae]